MLRTETTGHNNLSENNTIYGTVFQKAVLFILQLSLFEYEKGVRLQSKEL